MVILGQVTTVTKDQIVVEKTNFKVTSQTLIKNTTGLKLSLLDIATGTKVNVVGKNDKDSLVAQEITVNQDSNSDQNSIATTTTTASSTISAIPAVKGTTTVASTTQVVKEQPAPTSTPVITDPNTAVGSLIFEDPSPKFKQ